MRKYHQEKVHLRKTKTKDNFTKCRQATQRTIQKDESHVLVQTLKHLQTIKIRLVHNYNYVRCDIWVIWRD